MSEHYKWISAKQLLDESTEQHRHEEARRKTECLRRVTKSLREFVWDNWGLHMPGLDGDTEGSDEWVDGLAQEITDGLF